MSPTGAVAADARLILHGSPREAREVPPATDFSLLFEPRGVAVAGASTTKSSFGNWMLEAMRDMGRANLVAIHPAASAIEGVVAYPSLDAVPHPVDYVMATVPARRCAELIAGAGRARFVHVISGGFREAGAEGEDLERQLVTAARDANVRVLGPNCMGVFSPRGRLTFQLDAPRAVGHVSVVSQSGGLAADLIKVGDARGLRFSKLVSVGNAVDVTHAELLDWLVDDPDTDVVGLYIEDPRDGAGLVRALRRAAGRVPVVALVGGLSAQGGRAVASHTGALAADERIWKGISRSTGVTLVSSFEELVASLRFLQRYAGVVPSAGPNVLIAGVGGGATVLAADACDRAGLAIDLLGPGAKAVLSDRGYGVGTSIVNPIEIPIGPAVPPDLLATVLGAVLAEQPFSDLLVHLNVQQYFSFISGASGRLVPFIEAMGAASFGGARLALVVRNSECAPVEVRKAVEEACVANDLATFPTMYEAARAIGAVQLLRSIPSAADGRHPLSPLGSMSAEQSSVAPSRQRSIRFGAQVTKAESAAAWGELAWAIEDHGFDTLSMPDHLGPQLAPLCALSFAAARTSMIRLTMSVLDNDFRHPAVLAKEVATLDLLSSGRLELGLGAGWMTEDYDTSGIAFDSPGTRIERLAEAVTVVRGLLAPGPFSFTGHHYRITALEGYPRPVQNPVPLMVGGGGRARAVPGHHRRRHRRHRHAELHRATFSCQCLRHGQGVVRHEGRHRAEGGRRARPATGDRRTGHGMRGHRRPPRAQPSVSPRPGALSLRWCRTLRTSWSARPTASSSTSCDWPPNSG